MSEKLIEILTKVGFEEEKLKAEEINTDELLSEFRTKQRELLKNDPEFLDPIKESVKTEASIIATKKAKKSLNEKFGLGLSNKELDEKEYADLLEIATERSKGSATQEVNTLNEQIIALTNKLKEAEEGAESKVKEIERTWQEKYESGAREKLLVSEIAELATEKGLTISNDMALKVVRIGMQEEKYSIAFEGENHKVLQGEYEALTSDRTNKLTTKALVRKMLEDFTKKSNGAPQGQQQKSPAEDLDKLPQPMRERLEAMRSAVR